MRRNGINCSCNSVVECHLDKVEVVGSIPAKSTKIEVPLVSCEQRLMAEDGSHDRGRDTRSQV